MHNVRTSVQSGGINAIKEGGDGSDSDSEANAAILDMPKGGEMSEGDIAGAGSAKVVNSTHDGDGVVDAATSNSEVGAEGAATGTSNFPLMNEKAGLLPSIPPNTL